DNALAAAENLITANPDLTAIYSTGEPALMGAIAAFQSQGKQDKIKVFGWDLTAESIAGIGDGRGIVHADLRLLWAIRQDGVD
ncbi:substrate-binding domain-containing protein, partial [Rhizobium leguminosarum]|uniref:substrate-binding domain-containing protein n=1 Tax=Rhizobium leguminosarum TaxID=384 RepID=UPI003F99C505